MMAGLFLCAVCGKTFAAIANPPRCPNRRKHAGIIAARHESGPRSPAKAQLKDSALANTHAGGSLHKEEA